MDFPVGVVIFFILFFLLSLCFFESNQSNDRKKFFSEFIEKNVTNNMMVNWQEDGLKALVVDRQTGILSFYSMLNEKFIKLYKIGVNDIVSMDLIADEASISTVNRGSQAAGALVGGALLGGAGLIIGGLSGSQVHSSMCKNLKIKFIFNDLNNPKDEILFLVSGSKGVDKDDEEYKNAYEKADLLLCTLRIMIEKNSFDQTEIINKVLDVSLEKSDC